MKLVYIVYFLCFFVYISCGENDTMGKTNQAADPTVPIFIPGDTTNKIVQRVNRSVIPENGQSGAPALDSQIQSSTNSANSAGLNPKHGEPGHRCDIAVGAPLDSKPTTASQSSNSVSTEQKTVTQPTNTTSNSTGLNPKHGQPGHRCDIAVGAPLDSKPATVSQSSNSVSTEQKKVTKPTDTTSNSTGLNPKHGQPGHRCDIAVGAPLNSKRLVSTAPKQNLKTDTAQKIAEEVRYPTLPKNPAEKINVQSPATPVIGITVNPKHGQPGHRCDIAVGAPLNSKPKQ